MARSPAVPEWGAESNKEVVREQRELLDESLWNLQSFGSKSRRGIWARLKPQVSCYVSIKDT